MATHDYSIANQSGAAFRGDLNNALAAIVSNNSSASAPSPTFAYMWWVDTSSAPATLKQRNGANNAWVTVGQLDTANLGLLSSATAASTYAPLASPTFTGTPSVPTASVGTNSTVAASTAYVVSRVAQDAPTKTGGGASGTWGISISGNAATATSATTASSATTATSATSATSATNATNATNLTGTSTTNINSAALGSGTANSTTFLRGDRTWQVVDTTVSTAEALNATAGANAGDVGSYGFFSTQGSGVADSPGFVRGGSDIRWASVSNSSGSPSGSWRLLGYIVAGTAWASGRTSVYLRIS